jgi:hypothetical protein
MQRGVFQLIYLDSLLLAVGKNRNSLPLNRVARSDLFPRRICSGKILLSFANLKRFGFVLHFHAGSQISPKQKAAVSLGSTAAESSREI